MRTYARGLNYYQILSVVGHKASSPCTRSNTDDNLSQHNMQLLAHFNLKLPIISQRYWTDRGAVSDFLLFYESFM